MYTFKFLMCVKWTVVEYMCVCVCVSVCVCACVSFEHRSAEPPPLLIILINPKVTIFLIESETNIPIGQTESSVQRLLPSI
jgi:hypothetical protein